MIEKETTSAITAPYTPSEGTVDLAERLCAAWLSNAMGISLQHAYKAYVKDSDTPIGPYWVWVAERINEHMITVKTP